MSASTGSLVDAVDEWTSVVYATLGAVAALTSAGIWWLMIDDEQQSVGAATVEMMVKFTNLTVLLIALVAFWIAFGRSGTTTRRIAHATILMMAVVTAVVNAVLLDPGLPSGWWGVVDLFQHYLVPITVVTSWAAMGPLVDIPPSCLGSTLVVPLAWLVFVIVRGAWTDRYPYDFVDVSANGWISVGVAVAAILVAMTAAGWCFTAIDRRRARHRPRRRGSD